MLMEMKSLMKKFCHASVTEDQTCRYGFVVRALNCLKSADVETLGELVVFNKTDLLKFRNFGKKSLTELDELLANLNLSFGMDISKYKLDKE